MLFASYGEKCFEVSVLTTTWIFFFQNRKDFCQLSLDCSYHGVKKCSGIHFQAIVLLIQGFKCSQKASAKIRPHFSQRDIILSSPQR